MIQFHDFGFRHYAVLGLIVILLIMRIFAKKPLIAKNKDYISIFIFVMVGIIVGMEFWKKKIYIGLIALFLATLALGKMYWDKIKNNRSRPGI